MSHARGCVSLAATLASDDGKLTRSGQRGPVRASLAAADGLGGAQRPAGTNAPSSACDGERVVADTARIAAFDRAPAEREAGAPRPTR